MPTERTTQNGKKRQPRQFEAGTLLAVPVRDLAYWKGTAEHLQYAQQLLCWWHTYLCDAVQVFSHLIATVLSVTSALEKLSFLPVSSRNRSVTSAVPHHYFSPSSKPAPACIRNQTEPCTALPHLNTQPLLRA